MTGPDTPDPIAAIVLAERRELLRIAAARIVENARMGRRIADAETLQWAKTFLAANPALSGALGTGEPHTAPARI